LMDSFILIFKELQEYDFHNHFAVAITSVRTFKLKILFPS